MSIHEPLHPGEIVKDALLNEGTGLTVTSAAEKLGIERGTLSRLLNGHSGISPEMAMRLSIFLNTSVELWMNIQRDYDIWQLKNKRRQWTTRPLELAIAE